LIDPEDDGCGDTDSWHEGVGVAGGDASPVFEPTEHDLDFMALSIEKGVVRNVDFAVWFRGNARFNFARNLSS
jgi:hypothetical protein